MRAKNDKPAKGAGWIHDVKGAVVVMPVKIEPPRKKVQVDWPAEVKKRFNHSRAESTRVELAKTLGVSAESLAALMVGYGCERDGREFASFPMQAQGFVGFVRRYKDGSKKTAYGSRCGLFYSADWNKGGPVLMPEGASDVARLIDLGLSAIGRPSCLGGADLLARLLRGIKRQTLIVLGERDFHPEKRGELCPETCAGCGHCWPGRNGAIETARQLSEMVHRPVRAMLPPDGAKDARAWHGKSGAVFVEQLRQIEE